MFEVCPDIVLKVAVTSRPQKQVQTGRQNERVPYTPTLPRGYGKCARHGARHRTMFEA